MPNVRRQIALLALPLLVGCATPLPEGKSPLKPPRMSSDSIVLEMFFVRFPFGEPSANEDLWEEVDEQQFSSELRRDLSRNGFRAGLVEGKMPDELSKLLDLSDRPPPEKENGGAKIEDFESRPRVVRRRLQIRPGRRGEIIASGVYDRLPVLVCSDGQISGQTYNQAQGVFDVRWSPRTDGRARLELVPELHHDKPRQRWVGGQGMIRLETNRPKQVYDELTLSAELSPGAMLVLGSLSNRPGSLGHHFFTEDHGRMEQKLLVIRVAQTQHDGLFDPP